MVKDYVGRTEQVFKFSKYLLQLEIGHEISATIGSTA
jgi:hypothetical protein